MKKIFSAFLSISLCLTGMSFAAVDVSASETKPVIIAFGDSLTAAGVWVNNLNIKFGLDIINKGIGGNNTNDAKARFNTDVLSKNPDIVIICFGMNDSAKDMTKHVEINTYKNNLRYFINSLKDKGTKVILSTPNYIDETKYYTRHDSEVFASAGGAQAYIDTYCQVIRDIAEEQDVYLVDVREACKAYTDRNLLLTDGVHCTNLGYSIYSNLIGEQLTDIYLGDINLDGKITSTDYLMLKRHFLGTYVIPQTKITFADINGDGSIKSSDYLMLKRYFLGTLNIR